MKIEPEQIITENIRKKETVILGVSGGPDSIFLLDICNKSAKKNGFRVVISHVDHGMRKQSASDAEFVKKLAAEYQMPFECARIAKLPKGNLEDAFRNFRYAYFEKLRKKYNAQWIITAHHLNDNIETILLNLTRGTSIAGLAGMSVMDKKRQILRPLLHTNKEEIIKKIKEKKLKFIEDETNQDRKYSRNLVRLDIIPILKKINPSLEKTFLQNIMNFRQAQEFIYSQAENWIQNFSKDTNRFPLKAFLDLPVVLKKSILSILYVQIYGNTDKFNQNHLSQILSIMETGIKGKKKEFGDRFNLCIEKDNIKLFAIKPKKNL